jgi:RNA polymerase sigma factor (sigma-70 family)
MLYNADSTDAMLRRGCLAQHPLAQEWLYRRYFGRLLGIALRYTHHRSEAVEVLNMAFLKIFESLPNFAETGSFQGWMAKIVFHTAIDQVRREMAHKKWVDPNAGMPEHPAENEGLNNLQAEDLYALVQQLPTNSRSVFSLYVLDGYKHQEIAALLGINENTSKWHLREARLKLQALVKQHFKIEHS